jgi:hypothetical protein
MTTTSLDLVAARQLRDVLASMLRREQASMADFLVALADFDQRRGWELLGHASLFAFLRVEFGLSTAATFWRMSAARLLQRFPEVIESIRDGRLCLTTTAELAKVLTEENRSVVLPRFFGSSAREAKELVAELLPKEAPPLRAVVTSAVAAISRPEPALPLAPPASAGPLELRADSQSQVPSSDTHPESLRAPEMKMTHPARDAARGDDVEPLTADLRRLHVTVDRQFLKMLDAARDGLSHSIPGASTEQVLKAALELLLEKQARARGQVKRPRKTVAPLATPTPTPAPAPTAISTSPATEAATAIPTPVAIASPCPSFTEPLHRRTGPRESIPAAVRCAVWERDEGRCTWPLDGGGRCGSTYRLELDHIDPWARWGEETVDGLRILCRPHNQLAARQAFGARCMDRYTRSDPTPAGASDGAPLP